MASSPMRGGSAVRAQTKGFALRIANRLRPKLQLPAGEHADDAIRRCLGVAFRRASMFSRAPVVPTASPSPSHCGGSAVRTPPAELVELRSEMFRRFYRHIGHHYMKAHRGRRPSSRRHLAHRRRHRSQRPIPPSWRTPDGASIAGGAGDRCSNASGPSRDVDLPRHDEANKGLPKKTDDTLDHERLRPRRL